MPLVESSPPVVLLGVSVFLGLFLGYQFLRRRRNRPALIAFHILPGLGALELVAMLLRGAPSGAVMSGTVLGKSAALLMIVAIIVGLLTPMIARDRPRLVATACLAVHALLAGTAFVLLVVWVATQPG